MDALGEQVRAGADVLLPIDAGLATWPELRLDAVEAERFARGMDVFRPPSEWVGHCRVYGPDGRLLALGERAAEGRVRPRRVFRYA